MDKDLTSFVPGVSATMPSSPQTGASVVVVGSGQEKLGEVNPRLLILWFPALNLGLKGDGYRALGEGTADGEEGRWTALECGLASVWS